jgi:predicted dehydrogenase
MEKAHAVDGPGIRRVLKAGEEAGRKNLKIAGGLMSRHYSPLVEAIARIHEGLIGDVITCWAYREHGPVGFTPKPADSGEMAHQIRNFHNFIWLGGSFILDWLIHNIDICCWAKNAWRSRLKGRVVGRCVLCRTRCSTTMRWSIHSLTDADVRSGSAHAELLGFLGDVIHGSKGSAVLGEGIPIR